jgi:hypothetical protein
VSVVLHLPNGKSPLLIEKNQFSLPYTEIARVLSLTDTFFSFEISTVEINNFEVQKYVLGWEFGPQTLRLTMEGVRKEIHQYM